MKLPIPDAALDDRLGWFGTAGSGKTYNACSRVERLLDRKARVIIPDPLGVWWGLRLLQDGSRSPYNVVIFGGPHGDLPLTEHAGALVGETVAGMAESCILDLSQLGTKASERRFMLAFLTALYKHASGEPVHVVFDEADMWAPQKLNDKEGEAAKLLGMMETIVRRGRVKGFIPWLITQRPAVLSKDVLSQVDGLVAFKLTASQDRNALGGWVEGQADAGDWKTIHAALPTLERGRAIVWLPGRGVLDTVAFPAKKTFDSSRTPKRGERRVTADLEPLDITKLRDRLAQVETEIKASDPRALKAQIATLTRQLQAKVPAAPAAPAGASKADLATEYTRGREDGFEAGRLKAQRDCAAVGKRLLNIAGLIEKAGNAAQASLEMAGRSLQNLRAEVAILIDPPAQPAKAPVAQRIEHRSSEPKGGGSNPSGRTDGHAAAAGEAGKPMPRAMLTALAQHPDGLTKGQILVHTGYRSSGPVSTCFAVLAREGWTEARGSKLYITNAGLAALGPFEPLPTGADLRQHLLTGEKLSTMEKALLRAVFDAHPNEITKGEVLTATGYASSGPVSSAFARLVSFGYVKASGPSRLRASEDLFG